jgi:pimeloyl-ACP methyl ester carboxylesterase
MAILRPELFYAYVGHSQIVNPSIDEKLYQNIWNLASTKKDTASLSILTYIGKPPYYSARNAGKLIRIVKKYEIQVATPAPEQWFVPNQQYSDEKDQLDRENGDDYSFVNFVGDTALHVPSMCAGIDLLKDNIKFKIPVYIIQGDEDLLTPKESTLKYFLAITAPQKVFYTIPQAAHGFNSAVLQKQFEVFRSIKIKKQKCYKKDKK